MGKLCLSCMKEIPLFAGRCPYCIDDNQGVHGRFILLLIFLVGLILFANWYTDSNHKEQIETQKIEQELGKELKGLGF